MARIRANSGSGGGGGSNNCFEFTVAEMQACTDANPITINGDFSSATMLATYGQYATGSGYENKEYNVTDFTIGTQINMRVSARNNYVAYRHVTVYSDRIVIGSGWYNTVTPDSMYGFILKLIIG